MKPTAARRIRGLYAIADTEYVAREDLMTAVGESIAGGARVVQYRDKSGSRAGGDDLTGLTALCRRSGVPFIVNDDVGLAAALDADGVHLGRDDVDIVDARARLGAGKLVGVSCYDDLERALAAQRAGADYVAFGSFYPSATKPHAVRPTVEFLARARARLRLPIVAIGGITPENGKALIDAGADALAVISGLYRSSDVRAAAARYSALFRNHTD